MSLIRVEQVGSNTLERAEKLLAGIPDGMNRAVKSAMSRAASHLRTNSSKEIRKVYAISAGALRSEQNIKTKYTYHPGEGVSAQVLFSGCKIPLYRYNGTTPQQPTQDKSHPVTAVIQGHWRRTYPGVSAAGHQLASTSPVRFDGGFIARQTSATSSRRAATISSVCVPTSRSAATRSMRSRPPRRRARSSSCASLSAVCVSFRP